MTRPVKKFMYLAIEEAQQAKANGDYAIGAVIVKDGQLLAKGVNRVKLDKDPTHHAEIVAIREASKQLNSRHLEGCILYTTHEPCPMCAAAAVWARMKGIVSGATTKDMAAYSLKYGNNTWTWRTIDISASTVLKMGTPSLFLIEGFLREECLKLYHFS